MASFAYIINLNIRTATDKIRSYCEPRPTEKETNENETKEKRRDGKITDSVSDCTEHSTAET